MGLFSKKDPCAICGGKVKGIFPSKIDGQYICSDCYGVTDLPSGAEKKMSVEDFRAYMTFREENAQLKQQFQITQAVDFGWFDTKFVFDTNNRLLCMDKNLDKTIFEGSQIKSFVIKEDSTPVFQGSAAGLMRYPSAVPDRIEDMSTQIQMFRTQVKLEEAARKLRGQDEQDNYDRPRFDVPEPFEKFNVEIYFDHPYWDVFTADMSGPSFDDDMPDERDYMHSYKENIATMEQLARAIMRVAFPGAPETKQTGGIVMGTAAAPAANVDAVAEIKRYKDLLEQGVITEEEFTAKKKQLLGI